MRKTEVLNGFESKIFSLVEQIQGKGGTFDLATHL